MELSLCNFCPTRGKLKKNVLHILHIVCSFEKKKKMTSINISLKNIKGIYCIMNINNKKQYIGSSTNIYNRLQKHFSLLNHNKHENIILQSSFNKHGKEYFIHFLIEECDESYLLEREQYFINCLNPYYNITKQVIRNTLSKKSRKKISETLKYNYKNGYKQTQGTPIDVYDTKGTYIKSYDNAAECYRDLKISESSVFRVLSGKLKQCKGYVFYRKGDKNIKSIDISISGKAKKKKHLTTKSKSFEATNGSKKLIFNSLKDASEYFNVSIYIMRKSFNKRKFLDYLLAPVKLDELRENPEVDNPDLS